MKTNESFEFKDYKEQNRQEEMQKEKISWERNENMSSD